jgi:guanylate kinase
MTDTPGGLLVVSAPSGAGKSTLIAHLMQALPGLAFSVSWTTRRPRPGEVDGIAYHFTDETAFRRKVENRELLEWADVHGHLYGTGRAETEAAVAAGIDVVLDIDVQGAAQVRAARLAATFVFIMPPSWETLVARLTARATEDRAALEWRLASARSELPRWREFDHLIVNDDLAAAQADLVAIVRAARTLRERRAGRAQRILAGCPQETP